MRQSLDRPLSLSLSLLYYLPNRPLSLPLPPSLIIILSVPLTHLCLPDAPTTPLLSLSPSSLTLTPFVRSYWVLEVVLGGL